MFNYFTVQEVVNLLCLGGYAENNCEVKLGGNLSSLESRYCAARLATVEATLDTPLHTYLHPSCSVVVEALAGLLEVAVAFLCRVEPCLSQVLPVECAAAQLLSFRLGPGPLGGQQLDVAR